MEAAPPSYEAATLKNVWQLVAPYLTSDQLCQASLVSRAWHQTFAAQLWGKPTSHFGLEFNGSLDHLARFQKTLDFAEPSTRSFTYCLHLASNQAIYFDDRPSEWLRRLLDFLPNLQALLVPDVPYFDHAACQALQTSESKVVSSKGKALANHTQYGLRLLDARRCHNLTSIGLANALTQLASLVYLDLSFSYAAKDKLVYLAIETLQALRVLKLRSTRLTDDDIPLLSRGIGQRVCSLDLRDNKLTDKNIDVLLDHCFQDINIPRPHLDDQIYQAYTSSAVNRLTIEDVAARGITSLSISGNMLSEISLSKLMSQRSLQHLDIGRLNKALTPQLLLGKSTICSLKSLRVDHRVIRTSATGLYLPPHHLPSLQTLTLTEMPTHSTDQSVASAAIDFIRACASESYNAASLARSDYISPPGRRDAGSLQRAATQIFALQEIVLEMVQLDKIASLTGDKDSETMWSAGESDFSFFRNEAVEQEPKISELTLTKLDVNNLALLSAFRKDRKLAHDRAQQSARDQAEVPGYWPGTVVVQRNNE